MSLDSKYNRMKEFNKLFLNFKSVKTKKAEAQLKKERIMKNVDELYKNIIPIKVTLILMMS